MMASKKRAHLVIDQSVTGWRRTIGLIGSLLLWSGPPLLMLAWYREPWLSEFARPFAPRDLWRAGRHRVDSTRQIEPASTAIILKQQLRPWSRLLRPDSRNADAPGLDWHRDRHMSSYLTAPAA